MGGDADLVARITGANTVSQAFQLAGESGLALGDRIAALAWKTAAKALADPQIALEILVFDRQGVLVGKTDFIPSDHSEPLP
jgi:cobalt-precorrin-5B (C1)-methyltransferase